MYQKSTGRGFQGSYKVVILLCAATYYTRSQDICFHLLNSLHHPRIFLVCIYIFLKAIMKKSISLLGLIFGLVFAPVLAKVKFGNCPDEIAENCKKFIAKSKCCGTKGNICCSEEEYYRQFPNFGDDAQSEPEIQIDSTEFLLIVATIIVPLFVVCCICCFQCPFCLFSKHQRNGRVNRRNDQAQPQQQHGHHKRQQQPQHRQIIQTIPMQPNLPTGYPPQQDYPNQALPLASQLGYGYPQSRQSNVIAFPDDSPPYPGPPMAQATPPII